MFNKHAYDLQPARIFVQQENAQRGNHNSRAVEHQAYIDCRQVLQGQEHGSLGDRVVEDAQGDQGQPLPAAELSQDFMSAGQEVKWNENEKGQEIAHAGKGQRWDIFQADFDQDEGCRP